MMTNKHIKLALPVRVDGYNNLVDTEGFCVAYEGNVAPYNAVMNEVAKCVNYHHRLWEALGDALETLEAVVDPRHPTRESIETLLAELENLEDRGHE